ncbi:alpha/beta hydrolase [Jatrophihabitans sp.]|uniref:alpha/beta hydrolase n=1 Tax=Jatrophihabitans sp. TaxID=1932789 RepID=UPI0030C70C87|nr:Alpha/beta hydrolase fold-3 domain protein [Jatrophihabitans sp.]
MKTRTLTAAICTAAVVAAAIGITLATTGSSQLGSRSVPGIPAIAPVAKAASNEAVDRSYDVGHGNRVYAFWHQGEKNVPWVIKVHGGYWESGSGHRSDMLDWGVHEQSRGYAAFTVDYRLIPSVHWPTPELDVETAIRFIRAHLTSWGLDPSRGFIIGSSAGGLLASVAALELGGFAGVITLAGAVDPYEEYLHDPNPKLRSAALILMDDKTPAQDPKTWQDARAVSHLGTYRPPFLILHSLHDATVNVETARRFYGELIAAHYKATLDIVPGDTHPPTSVAAMDDADDWMDHLAHQPSKAVKVRANK